jgi:hypothetical protein
MIQQITSSDLIDEMQIKACLALAALAAVALAQSASTFKTRLAPVAHEMSELDRIGGLGQATASLAGDKLTVSGTFEGLKSPATIAQIHRSSVAGVRGPNIFDLTVDKATSGKISGSFTLDADQTDSLRKGRLYIQIHSEKAPDGNLWGWLMQ